MEQQADTEERRESPLRLLRLRPAALGHVESKGAESTGSAGSLRPSQWPLSESDEQ